MKFALYVTIFALLFLTTMALPADMDPLTVTRTCIERFGRTPRVECSSSADCSLVSTECPEHDCLPGRQGKTLCTWITY